MQTHCPSCKKPWAVREETNQTISCNVDDPRVTDFVRRYGHAIKDTESNASKKAVQDLTKELDDLKINEQRPASSSSSFSSSSIQIQQAEHLRNRVQQSVAQGLRRESWVCETCLREKALEYYSVRDQCRILAHWARIQTADWIDIGEDEDFVVVCKQCKKGIYHELVGIKGIITQAMYEPVTVADCIVSVGMVCTW